MVNFQLSRMGSPFGVAVETSPGNEPIARSETTPKAITFKDELVSTEVKRHRGKHFGHDIKTKELIVKETKIEIIDEPKTAAHFEDDKTNHSVAEATFESSTKERSGSTLKPRPTPLPQCPPSSPSNAAKLIVPANATYGNSPLDVSVQAEDRNKRPNEIPSKLLMTGRRSQYPTISEHPDNTESTPQQTNRNLEKRGSTHLVQSTRPTIPLSSSSPQDIVDLTADDNDEDDDEPLVIAEARVSGRRYTRTRTRTRTTTLTIRSRSLSETIFFSPEA